MDLLCQFQSTLLDVPVRRPTVQETTALGAAYLAGIAEDLWSGPDAIAWVEDASFTPQPAHIAEITDRYEDWERAVERSRAWAED
jgi:glycerol kinase